MTEGNSSGKHQNLSEEISSFLMIDQNFDKKSKNRCRAYSTLLGGTLYMIVGFLKRLHAILCRCLVHSIFLGASHPTFKATTVSRPNRHR